MKNKNESHDHSGSYMVRRNLHSIHKFAAMLLEMIDEHDEIESWMEHKISVAKAAISDVKDAYMYDQEEGDMSHDDDDHHGDHDMPHMKIAILRKADHGSDDFGLNKMMGGCGAANEGRGFLGSGTINENRQVICQKLNKKIFAESAEKIGNIIRIKTKSGETYEYIPYLGADIEMLRCEQYKVKLRESKDKPYKDKKTGATVTLHLDKRASGAGVLHVFLGDQPLVDHGAGKMATKSGKAPDFSIKNNNLWPKIMVMLSKSQKEMLEDGKKVVTDKFPKGFFDKHFG